MCGICGFYSPRTAEPADPRVLASMTELLDHRGPDDRGTHFDGPLALGFTRLSIIDLGGGHQPMCNEQGDVWLVFNGEIWNYQQLRAQLQAQGHVFRTAADTETVIHAYEEYGLGALERLHGMFGFALWDA